jgi:hypothetical protein
MPCPGAHYGPGAYSRHGALDKIYVMRLHDSMNIMVINIVAYSNFSEIFTGKVTSLNHVLLKAMILSARTLNVTRAWTVSPQYRETRLIEKLYTFDPAFSQD